MMGVPFTRRGKRMDECIEIIRGLTSGDYFEFHGEFYDIPKMKMTPAPTEPIPILIGGHADAALRRAARNDGWMHGGGTEDLDELLAKLNCYRDEEGTSDGAHRDGAQRERDFQVHVISLDAYTADGIKRLEDKGVTDVIVGFRLPYITGPDPEPLDDKIRNLEMFADTSRDLLVEARTMSRALVRDQPDGSQIVIAPNPLHPPQCEKCETPSAIYILRENLRRCLECDYAFVQTSALAAAEESPSLVGDDPEVV